jgi:flagellar basal body rod protein FlgG
MIGGIFNNAASLSALERWQSTITQNLASSAVAGFKKSSFAIESDDRKKMENNPQDVSAARYSLGVPTRTTSINFSPGEIRPSGKQTDFAITGPGFFQVQGQDGQNLYTRDGEFQINNENTLVTKNGLPVLGDGGPITIDPDQGPLVIAKDGSISQGDNLLGRMALYDFEDTDALKRVEGGFFSAEGQDPELVENAMITQGAIEGSNVSPMAEMVNLIAVARAYEASQRAMTSHDDLASKAIQTLGSPTA